MWRVACGTKCNCFSYWISRRGNAVRYIGTMLSLWKDAAVYGSNFRAEDKKSSDWIQRPKSESGRKGSEDIKRCRCSGCGRFYEGQMWWIKSNIFSLYNDQNTICSYEVCNDAGWKNCNKDRSFKVDHPRSRTQRSTVYASSVYGNHGRDRNGTCWWSNAECPGRRA